MLPILEMTLQRHIQRRLQREGWKVAPAVTIRAKQGGAFRCHIDLHAERPRRGLMIEVKPNWPPYQAIGQLVYYYYAVKRERKLSLPKDLALATWKRSEEWDRPLAEACFDARVRLWLFARGNYRAYTMKHVGSNWEYRLLAELAPPRL